MWKKQAAPDMSSLQSCEELPMLQPPEGWVEGANGPNTSKNWVAKLVQMDSCCRDAELLVLWTVFRYLIILYHHSFGTNDKKIKIHTHLDISFEAPFWVHLVVLVLILWHRNTVMNLSLGALHLSPLHTSWLRQWRCCRWNQGVYP